MSENVEPQVVPEASTEVTQTAPADSANETDTTEINTTSEETEVTNSEVSEEPKESQSEPVENPVAMKDRFTEELQKFFEGTLSEADYKKIESMGYTKEDFNLVASALKAQQDKNTNDVLDSIGGPQVFQELNKFAEMNLKQEERDAINHILKTDVNLAKLVLQGVKAQMDAKNGFGPSMRIESMPVAAQADMFGSKQELVNALVSHKYKQDPSYKQEVDNFRRKKGW